MLVSTVSSNKTSFYLMLCSSSYKNCGILYTRYILLGLNPVRSKSALVIHPFFFQQVFLSTYYVPGTILDTDNIEVNKTGPNPGFLMEFAC